MILEQVRRLIPNCLVNSLYHLPKAVFSNLFFGFPSRDLRVIGVTGTDGKTTAATLIYHILKKAGKKVALITTVSVKMGKKEVETGLHTTSPDPLILQRFLKEIKNKGFEFVVLEVTSHGLAQHRVWGVNFEVAVVTNVTHEHLDYHKTFENYLKTKAKILRKAKISVLNKEEKNFAFLKSQAKGQVITFGLKSGDLNPRNFFFKTRLLGDFNQLNCLAAIAAASVLRINKHLIKKAVVSFKGVAGRMQAIDEGQDFTVIIDFAHTPHALEQALTTLKEVYKPRKMIAVFGCAGLRDKRKRPMMGKIACQQTDVVVLTAEDPRREDVGEIISQIASGCKDKNKIYKKSDRQKAIKLAIVDLASKGDLVGVFGKGHEKSMCFGRIEHPWSDEKAVRKALNERLKNDD